MPPTIGEAPDQCKNKGTAFPMQISNHVGRVEISEIMRTHQGFVENAKPGVDTMLDFKSVSYQQSRRRNPDWRPSLWNQFVREESDKTFIKGVKTAKSEVDCGPPKNAMKYSKWRAGYRKRMEKKGIKQTKATEIMWSFQEEDNAKHHLRRHQHVIRKTPSCVDHHPPVEAMAHRKWKRETASTHKVDAPLPRPKSARFTQWKNTFDCLNLSIKDVTKADLSAPMLELEPLIGFEQPAASSHQAAGSFCTSPAGGDCDELESSPQLHSSPQQQSSPQVQSSPQQQRSLSQQKQRPQSQQSQRSQSQQSQCTQKEKLTRQRTQRREVHSGRPSQYSAALSQAYMGAASNDNVRKMLLKNEYKKGANTGRSRPGTAC